MRKLVNIKVKYPYLFVPAITTVQRTEALDDVAARVVSLVVFKKSIKNIDETDTLNEAMIKVFNTSEKINKLYDEQINNLFETRTFTLQNGKFIDWKKVILGDIVVNESINNKITGYQFVGLNKTSRKVNENYIFSINEKIGAEIYKDYSKNGLPESAKITLTVQQSKVCCELEKPKYAFGAIADLIETSNNEVIISTEFNGDRRLIEVEKKLEFELIDDTIFPKSEISIKYLELIKSEFENANNFVVAIKDSLDFDKRILVTANPSDNFELIAFEDAEEFLKNLEPDFMELDFTQQITKINNHYYEIQKIERKIGIDNINEKITINIPTKKEFNWKSLIDENWDYVPISNLQNLKSEEIKIYIFKKIINSNYVVDNQELINASAHMYQLNKSEIWKILNIISIESLTKVLVKNREVIESIHQIIEIQKSSGISIEKLYEIFEWEYNGHSVFPEWQPEINYFKLIEKIEEYQNDIEQNNINEAWGENVIKTFAYLNTLPIKNVIIEQKKSKIINFIKVIPSLDKNQADALAIEGCKKLEAIAEKFISLKERGNISEKLKIVVENDNSLEQFKSAYGFFSEYLHKQKNSERLYSKSAIEKLKETFTSIENISLKKLDEK